MPGNCESMPVDCLHLQDNYPGMPGNCERMPTDCLHLLMSRIITRACRGNCESIPVDCLHLLMSRTITRACRGNCESMPVDCLHLPMSRQLDFVHGLVGMCGRERRRFFATQQEPSRCGKTAFSRPATLISEGSTGTDTEKKFPGGRRVGTQAHSIMPGINDKFFLCQLFKEDLVNTTSTVKPRL